MVSSIVLGLVWDQNFWSGTPKYYTTVQWLLFANERLTQFLSIHVLVQTNYALDLPYWKTKREQRLRARILTWTRPKWKVFSFQWVRQGYVIRWTQISFFWLYNQKKEIWVHLITYPCLTHWKLNTFHFGRVHVRIRARSRCSLFVFQYGKSKA